MDKFSFPKVVELQIAEFKPLKRFVFTIAIKWGGGIMLWWLGDLVTW